MQTATRVRMIRGKDWGVCWLTRVDDLNTHDPPRRNDRRDLPDTSMMRNDTGDAVGVWTED